MIFFSFSFSSSFDPFQLIPCNPFFHEEKQVLFIHHRMTINNALLSDMKYSFSMCARHVYKRLGKAGYTKGQMSDTDGK